MPGRPLTRQSWAILADLNTTPEWWEGAQDRLACGDDPQDVADEYCILFGVFMRWVEKDEERKREYDAALRIASEGMAHKCKKIADGAVPIKINGIEVPSDVQRDKLRIDTNLKLAGKWDRARYGEKIEISETKRYVIEVPAIASSSEEWKALSVPAHNVIDVQPSVEVIPG